MNNIVLKSSIYAVILNIFLSIILSQFATKDEIKPPNGAGYLSYKSQIMHMLVHHNQVLFISSLIIFVLTMISVYLATIKI